MPCDTFAFFPPGGGVLFAKNSDRDANEASRTCHLKAESHGDAQLHATYITIPQAQETHEVLLCCPCWTWGAEMGANSHGVVAGNEALLHTLAPPATPQLGLIGMDLLRLALERATTAEAALGVITSHLEAHGQEGDCGLDHPFFYWNAFLLADANTPPGFRTRKISE